MASGVSHSQISGWSKRKKPGRVAELEGVKFYFGDSPSKLFLSQFLQFVFQFQYELHISAVFMEDPYCPTEND